MRKLFDVRNLKTKKDIADFIYENRIFNPMKIKEIKENEEGKYHLFSVYIKKVKEIYKDLFETTFEKYNYNFEFDGKILHYEFWINWSKRDNKFDCTISRPGNKEDEIIIEKYKHLINPIVKSYVDKALEKNAILWAETIIMMRKDKAYKYTPEKKIVLKKREGKPITWELKYHPTVFSVATKKQIGGNYPIGGELIAKVDEELLKTIIEHYNSNTRIMIGDKIEMNNGWSLD